MAIQTIIEDGIAMNKRQRKKRDKSLGINPEAIERLNALAEQIEASQNDFIEMMERHAYQAAGERAIRELRAEGITLNLPT